MGLGVGPVGRKVGSNGIDLDLQCIDFDFQALHSSF